MQGKLWTMFIDPYNDSDCLMVFFILSDDKRDKSLATSSQYIMTSINTITEQYKNMYKSGSDTKKTNY